MGQILAIDYGKKRCGLAVTDDLKMIASGLDTVDTSVLLEYLKKYFIQNQVDKIVIGFPVDLRGNVSEVEGDILRFIEEFQNIFQELLLISSAKVEKIKSRDKKKV